MSSTPLTNDQKKTKLRRITTDMRQLSEAFQRKTEELEALLRDW